MDEWGSWQARDRRSASDRPGTVVAAAIFMFLGVAIAVWFTFAADGSPIFIIWGVAYAATAAGVLQRNFWAWIAALALAGWATFGALLSVRLDSNVVAFILLLTPRARKWFTEAKGRAGDG